MAVLLVEDDIAVRLTLAEFLEAAGFQILEAEDADEALTIFADPMQRIDLLITDVDLGPGDNGLLLAAKARRFLPDLQVIYVTGGPERFASHSPVPCDKVFFKPFSPDVLVAAATALSKMLPQQRRAYMRPAETVGMSNP